jgi:hypothetical protein
MALWESLDDSQREKELSLIGEQLDEIDRYLPAILVLLSPGESAP